jgi:DivIVA domain-containing protein
MANSHTSDSSPQRFGRGTPASELLRNVSFPLAVRGYDRRAVDELLEELRNLVADLEAHQTREGVVQKALDELGEETAGILQRAHETADDIAARSRAQADGRLQRAEREAEIVKREADEYAEQVVADTKLLWDERQRLIEDIRHLADEVLGTADDAIERLKLPEPLAAAEQEEAAASGSNVTPIPHPLSIARDPEPDVQSDPSIPYDLETPEEDPEAAAPWGLAAAEDEEEDPDTTAHWRGAAAGDEDPNTSARWRRAAAEDEDPDTTARYEDPDTAERWGAAAEDADEHDPDATVAWSAVGGDDPETTAPYALEDEYGEEGEDDPNPTAPWTMGAARDEDDPGAMPADEPDSDDDDAGHQTAELEALPGGNTDDQAAEPERKRD